MKITRIYYKELISTGNYENTEIGVEVEVNDNENPGEAFEKAREFVKYHHPDSVNKRDNKIREAKYNDAKKILSEKEKHLYPVVEEAKKIVDEFDNDFSF